MSHQSVIDTVFNVLRLAESTNNEELLALLPDVLIYPALDDMVYGGPEEGGWWYPMSVPIPRPNGREYKTMRLDKALTYIEKLNDMTEKLLNSRRRSNISSVLSEGRFVWRYTFENQPPEPETQIYS